MPNRRQVGRRVGGGQRRGGRRVPGAARLRQLAKRVVERGRQTAIVRLRRHVGSRLVVRLGSRLPPRTRQATAPGSAAPCVASRRETRGGDGRPALPRGHPPKRRATRRWMSTTSSAATTRACTGWHQPPPRRARPVGGDKQQGGSGPHPAVRKRGALWLNPAGPGDQTAAGPFSIGTLPGVTARLVHDASKPPRKDPPAPRWLQPAGRRGGGESHGRRRCDARSPARVGSRPGARCGGPALTAGHPTATAAATAQPAR